MPAKQQGDRVGKMVRDVEALAKSLRTELRKRAEDLPKNLHQIAHRLRKQAAAAAAQVEKYVHAVRKELETAPKARPRAKAAKRRTKTAR